MSTATLYLPAKSINWLQDLIQVNIDSRDGFQDAVDNLEDQHSSLAVLFRHVSRERDAQAHELQAMVAQNAEQPAKSGSVAAAAHRTWMDIRAAFGGGDQAILSEAERGEDHIKEKYESALKDLTGCACVGTLQKQYAAVKASHDKVRALRDLQAKA